MILIILRKYIYFLKILKKTQTFSFYLKTR